MFSKCSWTSSILARGFSWMIDFLDHWKIKGFSPSPILHRGWFQRNSGGGAVSKKPPKNWQENHTTPFETVNFPGNMRNKVMLELSTLKDWKIGKIGAKWAKRAKYVRDHKEGGAINKKKVTSIFLGLILPLTQGPNFGGRLYLPLSWGARLFSGVAVWRAKKLKNFRCVKNSPLNDHFFGQSFKDKE